MAAPLGSETGGAAAVSSGHAGAAEVKLRPFMPRQLYFYDCDGFGDTGWGCGYRCLQTLLSGVEADAPTFADAVAALNGREGVFADIGDIQVLMQARYGWGAQAIQLAVRCVVRVQVLRLAGAPQRRLLATQV